MKSKCLVLTSYINADTNSVCFQELVDLLRFERTDHLSDIEQGYEIELSCDEFYNFVKTPTSQISSEGRTISLVRLRRVPSSYQKKDIPAGGELFSLLHGKKGLAAFRIREGDKEEIILDEQPFGKFLDSGTITKRTIYLQIDGSTIRYLLFYPTTDAWRADIYESLKRHLAAASWTEYLEHIEAIVLGTVSRKSDRIKAPVSLLNAPAAASLCPWQQSRGR
ncbi:hypothetical protein [Pelagerythrobacter sp.]|uniref:hypothetical protein n=1 Tax=Pelagerythrobacter sp. TaxID=2800702 RepID=UPI0035AE2EFA